MEQRKIFIGRMHMMVNEIKNSNVPDYNIFSMLEYQLKEREKELLKDVKRRVIGEMEKRMDSNVSTQWIVTKGNDKFLDIIDDL
jgi:hypothetical protein